jgi:hypothetical protein
MPGRRLGLPPPPHSPLPGGAGPEGQSGKKLIFLTIMPIKQGSEFNHQMLFLLYG